MHMVIRPRKSNNPAYGYVFTVDGINHVEDGDLSDEVARQEAEVIDLVRSGHVFDGSVGFNLNPHTGDGGGVNDQLLTYREWKDWRKRPKRVDKLAPEYKNKDRVRRRVAKKESSYKALLDGLTSTSLPRRTLDERVAIAVRRIGKKKVLARKIKAEEDELWAEFQEVSEAIWGSDLTMEEKKQRTRRLNDDWREQVMKIRGQKHEED